MSATIRLQINTFRAYSQEPGSAGMVQVMDSSARSGSDVTFSVPNGGGGLLSVNAAGNLAFGRKKGGNDNVRIEVAGPAGNIYKALGLVTLPLTPNAVAARAPFGEFTCRADHIDVRDTTNFDATWEFFVLVQQIAPVAGSNPKSFSYSFGLIDPKIQNT